MDKKFPILSVASAALKLPFSSPVNIMKALGLLILPIMVLAVLLTVTVMVQGIPPEKLVDDLVNARIDPSIVGVLVAFTFCACIVIAIITAHIFNYWVRYGAFGAEGAAFGTVGQAVKAALVNGVKFFLIVLLIALASFLIYFVLMFVGLLGSLEEQAEAARLGLAAQTKSMLLLTVLSTIGSCIIYSLFSANLTQTAIGSGREGLDHPHTMDFAITLMLVYAVYLVPYLIFGLMGSAVLMNGVSAVLGMYTLFSVGIAHGLRYRICLHELGNAPEKAAKEVQDI